MESLQYSNNSNLENLLTHLFNSFIKLSDLLRNGSGGKETQSKNKFGDIQLDTDVQCDEIIFENLKNSGQVAFGLSEEKPELIEINGADKEYIVTFDPLDGSSIIGVNFTVGSIFGIWKNDSNRLIGQKVGEQITAGAVMYGSRTSLIFFNTKNNQIEELTLKNQQWIQTKSNIKINPKGNIFAPGNLRAGNDYPQYKKCIDYWINNGYTLRYTGGMVPDIYQLFIKSQGVFTNLGSQKNPAKLRLLYEVAPLSFLVEKAGGKSFDGKQNMMDVVIDSYDQRIGIVVGSKEEVERVENFLKEN